MLSVALSLSAGCVTASTECAGWRPIWLSAEDVLTRETQRQILSHNLHGEARGCW